MYRFLKIFAYVMAALAIAFLAGKILYPLFHSISRKGFVYGSTFFLIGAVLFFYLYVQLNWWATKVKNKKGESSKSRPK